MKVISCILVAIIFLSCGNQSAIDKKLSGSDSLVVTFNVPGSDSVLNKVSTTEKKAISKLSGFLNGKKRPMLQCGFDGNMIFFGKGEILLTVIFQYSEKSCRYFLFDLGDKVKSYSMSEEAAGFLKSLAEGKSWY